MAPADHLDRKYRDKKIRYGRIESDVNQFHRIAAREVASQSRSHVDSRATASGRK